MTEDFPIAERLRALLARQTSHKVVPLLELADAVPDGAGCFAVQIGQTLHRMSGADIVSRFEARERWIDQSAKDHYNYGIWFPSWDVNLWEICRLRIENPGVPIHFLVGGSNGSAKTFFAAAVVIRAMMQTQDKMFWCLSMDEPNSTTVQQTALYWWLPNDYKTETGAIKGTARGKLRWNDSGGFTDNRFSLRHGAKMECRFWSKDIGTLEGPRPYAVWSDEEIPLPWLEGIERRLITQAEPTEALVPKWKQLVAQKAADPLLEFPRDLIGELMMGVHLITYTAKSGWTPTVSAFMHGGRVMQRIEADPELLPRRDEEGVIIGGEWVPKLVYCKDKAKRMIYMHAWDNPLGGNWKGLREKSKGKPRTYILWLCYGVAERNASTPLSNFDPQAHVRPISLLPRVGTWYHVCDPVASGGRCWFMIWALVVGEVWGRFSAGDIFVAHEYPQTNDVIPGEGMLGAWAEVGGEKGLGVRGPGQKPLHGAFETWASEIRRIERKLAEWQGLQFQSEAEWERHMKEFIPDENRIMDSRASSTKTVGQSEAKTLIQYMADNEIYFIRAGNDSGAEAGMTRVQPGEQAINDAFHFNRSKAELNPKTGWLECDLNTGRGPKLWIADHCTNLIDAIQNYPGIGAPGADKSPFKDPIDCLRYLIIADPMHVERLSDEDENDYGGVY